MDEESKEVRQDPRLPQRHGKTALRLWYSAPIGIDIEWHVLATEDGYFVRQFISRQSDNHDAEDFANEASLTAETYWLLLHGLRAVRMTPFEPSELVLDNVHFGVWAESYPQSVKLAWTGTPPGWKALRTWYRTALKTLDAQLPHVSAAKIGSNEI